MRPIDPELLKTVMFPDEHTTQSLKARREELNGQLTKEAREKLERGVAEQYELERVRIEQELHGRRES